MGIDGNQGFLYRYICSDDSDQFTDRRPVLHYPSGSFEQAYFERAESRIKVLFERKKGFSQFHLGVLQFHRTLSHLIGLRYIAPARLGELPVHDRGDCGHEVARLCHLLVYFGGRQSEVVEYQHRLPPQTGNDGVGHILDRLSGLLRLELGKFEIFAEIFQRYSEVFRHIGGFHQLKIVYRPLGRLAQVIEQIGTVQRLERTGHPIGGRRHIDALGNEVFHLT